MSAKILASLVLCAAASLAQAEPSTKGNDPVAEAQSCHLAKTEAGWKISSMSYSSDGSGQ